MSKLVRQWYCNHSNFCSVRLKMPGELNRYLKHVCFKDESLGHILKVMNMNAGSSQIRVASPALEKKES